MFALGVIGLGAIGAKVANIAIDLGMDVLGYDPYISVDAAWRLSRKVKHEKSLDALFSGSDYVSIHMPLTNETKGIINKNSIANMKDGVCIINCARGELVDNDDLKQALSSGKVSRYVTDFPTAELLGVEGVVTIPHLGASTPEAEDNCAIMAARQLVDYIENGNVANSVNFPNLKGPDAYAHRVTIVHKNVPYMINYATKPFSDAHINIDNLVSAGRGDVGYMILDTEKEVPESVIEELKKVDGFLKVRVIR